MRAMCAAVVAVGCVTQGRFDAEVAARDSEHAERLAAEKDAARLEGELRAAKERVEKLDARLSEAEYAVEVAERERKTAEEMVEQLRAELSRVGEHIKHFAHRNVELEQVGEQLGALEQDVEHRLNILEELTKRLGQTPPSSGVSVMVKDGYPAMRFAAGSAVSARGLNKDAKTAVATLAALLEARPGRELVALYAPGDDASRSVAEVIADAVRAKAGAAPVDVLEADGVDRGVALVIVRRAARPASGQ
jgi:predicted RNase H-like nuclease (RuvC/YqgF family)